VVARAVELTSPLTQERRQQIVVQVRHTGLGVRVDEDRMAQAITNLLTNAAKYSDDGSTITIAAERDGPRVRLRVTDEGMGIAPEMIDSIFDRFVQQSQTLERASGGLGLGLTIARAIVELHGGTLRARSEGLGTGSEFTIELPAIELHERRSAAPGPDRPQPQRERTRRGHKRILVVEDNPDAAATLREALEHLGYDVAVARDGPSALAEARSFQPDIALVDIGLPLMDGYALAEQIRGLGPLGNAIHLVALTGYGQDADRRRSADAGFERHLVKPVDLAQLEAVFEALQ
jgi:CheY-like chemotaxis protein